MKINKITDKVDIFDVEAQGSYACEHDCSHYSDTKSVGEPPNTTEPGAIYICGCFSTDNPDSESTSWW